MPTKFDAKLAKLVMLNRVLDFESAAYKLSADWDDNLGDHTEHYPFAESFDEMCARITTWRESLQRA